MGSAREVEVVIGDRQYLMTSDDDYLDIVKDNFDPPMVKLFRVLASNSRDILDIGANVGCTALLFGGLAETVHAFEPSPTTFQFLQKNVSMSGMKNVFAHNMGLGAEHIETTLTFAPSNRAGGFVSNQTQASVGHTTEKVVIQRLDDVVSSLNLRQIDFIKIDVEGFEAQVLRGGMQALKSHRPVVVLELNHWALNAFQRTSIPDFFYFLRSVFPILLAVDGSAYLDLYNESESYVVMYHHILHFKFPNIVASFSEEKLSDFRSIYEHTFRAL